MSEQGPIAWHDLRALALGAFRAVGVPPDQSALMANLLMNFEAMGRPDWGLARLGDWLGRTERGEHDLGAQTLVLKERPATIWLDLGNPLPPVGLARGLAIAVDKAREAGACLVRARNLRENGPIAPGLAEAARGPFVAWSRSPMGRTTIALPTGAGLPFVWEGSKKGQGPQDWAPAIALGLAGPEEWLIGAQALDAWGPIEDHHARTDAALPHLQEGPGRLLPGPWSERRDRALARGIDLEESTRDQLNAIAKRWGLPPIAPRQGTDDA